MSPKRRAEFKLKSMKKMGLKPGDLQKKPGGRPKLTKSQMLLQAQGKDLKGGPVTMGVKKKKPKKFNQVVKQRQVLEELQLLKVKEKHKEKNSMI